MDYSATEQRHEVAAEQVGKMEVCNWMKVKAKGFLGNEEGQQAHESIAATSTI